MLREKHVLLLVRIRHDVLICSFVICLARCDADAGIESATSAPRLDCRIWCGKCSREMTCIAPLSTSWRFDCNSIASMPCTWRPAWVAGYGR